ncbi:unnamed protein product [Brassicogethes aeneus]|uniref:Uncharacterized protein n=1 Tax=Brassicogethes aeneus TaxID=1431903 RepID=A0A9P0BDB6_BRAAE|nr:unnamed protein product [Brassicogethes aeneus]
MEFVLLLDEHLQERRRRRPREQTRLVLTEVNETVAEQETPNKESSPDEMLIMQRGPRRKPITWSPVDYDKFVVFGGSRGEKTPEPVVVSPARPDMNPKIRRRLIMTPEKTSSDLGEVIAKKLRSLQGFGDSSQ